MNPLYTFEQLPTTSGQAIREFNTRYLATLTAFKPTGWADRFAYLLPTKAPKVTYPISAMRTKYRKTTGESSFKRAGEKKIDLMAEEFDDGYEAKLMDLQQEVFAYRNWNNAASRFVTAEESFRHQKIAALLEAGESTACWDGKNFFATDHPANPFDAGPGTFSNYQSSTKDVVSLANIEAERTAMEAGVLDENGELMGVHADTIFVPLAKAEPLRNLLKKAMLATASGNAAETNPYADGSLTVVAVREFADTNDWYLADSKLIQSGGFDIALAMRQELPPALALRFFDEASDYFKNTGKLAVSSHIQYGFGYGFPHAIRKIKGA